MLFESLIRIYKELGSVPDYTKLGLDCELMSFGTVQYTCKIGEQYSLEYRTGLKMVISNEPNIKSETSQLRIYHRVPNKPIKSLFTIVRFPRTVVECTELTFNNTNHNNKVIVSADTLPIRTSISKGRGERIKLWEMSEEEIFQFSLIDDFDFNLLDRVLEDVTHASHDVKLDESYLIIFRNDTFDAYDFSVLDEFTVLQKA